MSYNILGTLILLIIIAVIYPFLHRFPKVKQFMSKWYFWTVFAIIFFAFNLTVYIRVSIMDEFFGNGGIHGNPPIDSAKLDVYTSEFSVMLFLSISTFGTMFLPLSLIFNPTRKIASYLSPILLLGGFLNLVVRLASPAEYDLDMQGNYTIMALLWYNDASIIRHFLLAIMSYLVLFNVPKYKLWKDKWYRTDTFKMTAIWVGYLSYVSIVTGILYAIPATNQWAGHDSNGLFPRDWETGGQYEFLSFFRKYYPLGTILLYAVIISLTVAELILFNKIKTYKSFKYKAPDHWYIKSLGGPKHKWWQW